MANETNHIEPSVDIQDGKFTLDDQPIDISPLYFIEEISRGANGIVLLAKDPILERNVVVKIWLKLRHNDSRDKVLQGMMEVRKQTKAEQTAVRWEDPKFQDPYFIPDPSDTVLGVRDMVGHIYSAGYAGEYFYTVMEYLEGVPLRAFLKENQALTFGIRYHIALRLNQYNQVLISNGIYHGDLHDNNVMIQNYRKIRKNGLERKEHTFDLKIIDFGTSCFVEECKAIHRTYSTLMETVNKCISPFTLKDIHGSPMPKDPKQLPRWITKQLWTLRAGFYELKQFYVGWPFYLEYGTYMPVAFGVDTAPVKALIEKYAAEGKIRLDREFLGRSEDWDTFNGETAKRGD